MSPKISVIVPAYNAEKTIERCLKSILKQTYHNLEVIVVNDGSKDSTELILSRIEKNDVRVHLITIENGGVSHARNVGIDNASGEYITFVDSDDYIDEEMYTSLMELIQKYDIGIIPDSLMAVYLLNPMTPIINTFRYAFLGIGSFDLTYYLISLGISVIVLLIGIIMFNKVERTFMDTV